MNENIYSDSQLLLRSLKEELNEQENILLQQWVSRSPAHARLLQEMIDTTVRNKDLALIASIETEAAREKLAASIFDEVHKNPSLTATTASLKKIWFRYAAIFLLVLAGATTWMYLREEPAQSITSALAKEPDVAPGKDKATLTLADGSTIILDDAANGSLAQQGNTSVLKMKTGAIAYKPGASSGVIQYNAVNTPKGGQYQVTLPDGSIVWLNAASGIRFPTSFGKDRTIEITGECYLEVVADKHKPFFVKTGSTLIQVLGTSFNVKAYADEPAVKTSLLKGAVKVDNTILKPGEAYQNGKVIPTNIEQDIAWKNGVFNFEDQQLQEVMRQLARWYDLEIRYEGNIPDIQFGGKMGRDVNLSSILNFLKKWGVHFQIKNDGKELIVSG